MGGAEVAQTQGLYSVLVRQFSGTWLSVIELKFGVFFSRGKIMLEILCVNDIHSLDQLCRLVQSCW